MSHTPFPIRMGSFSGQIFTDGVGVSAPDVSAARYPDHVEQMRAEIGDAPRPRQSQCAAAGGGQ